MRCNLKYPPYKPHPPCPPAFAFDAAGLCWFPIDEWSDIR
jgi:hypothetical protein